MNSLFWKTHSCGHGEVVGWIAAVRGSPDDLRIGDGDPGTHKDMIDFLTSRAAQERVKRTHQRILGMDVAKGIRKSFFQGQDRGIVFSRIEIAREDNGDLVRRQPDGSHEQVGAAFT